MLGNRKYRLKSKDKNTNHKENAKTNQQSRTALIQQIKAFHVYMREKNISKKAVTLAAALLVLVGLAGVKYREDGTLLPTSSTVGNKELPIYCVQTEEPKIALTFDAAWGNSN